MSTRSWVSRPVARIAGTTAVAPDKSISHRALILGAVANEPVTIKGLLRSEDCLATRRALEQIGATTHDTDGGLVVIGGRGMGKSVLGVSSERSSSSSPGIAS